MAYIQTVLCMNKVSVLEICPRSSYNYILQRHAIHYNIMVKLNKAFFWGGALRLNRISSISYFNLI